MLQQDFLEALLIIHIDTEFVFCCTECLSRDGTYRLQRVLRPDRTIINRESVRCHTFDPNLKIIFIFIS